MVKRQTFKTLVITGCLLLGALALWQWQTRPATAAGQVEDAWQNVLRSDSYAFSADVVVETIPLPTTGNIGRFSKQDAVYLEGSNNLRDGTLQLALWGGAVSAADPAAAFHVRVADGQIQTRAGNEPWQDSALSEISLAPDGDFLAFLDFAQDVAWLGAAQEGAQRVSKYSFTIDGPAYANHLRTLTQQRLVAEGNLPPGVALSQPQHLADMTAQGELWVDARGVPVREIVTMQMPPAAGADYRSNTALTIYFSDYSGLDLARNGWQPLRMAAFTLSRLPLPDGITLGTNLSLVLGALLLTLLLVRVRVNRRLLVVFNSALLAILVLAPLAGVGTARAHAATLAAYYADNDITPPDPLTIQPARPAVDIAQWLAPRRPNVPLGSVNLQTGTVDTDADGLTDEVEALIGTNPYSADTDLDQVSDLAEVNGFLVGSTRWYGNPLAPDSNGDSVPDNAEWNLQAPDSDGDGTPDLHDWDDDNDGVPDSVDISRVAGSKDNAGNPVTFDETNPFVFTLNGARQDSFVYLALQLRPTNPDHLWYAFNVLNWPKDEKGTMQDWDGLTLFDQCVASGGSNCNMSPDDNGDLKFVPMLEISVANAASLPRLANGQPDRDLMARYNMSLQPNGDGYLLYVPLNLLSEAATGSRVAFQTQLLLQPGASFAPQQMRMVWVVQALKEAYANAEAYKDAKESGQSTANNQLTVLQTYPDSFQLTGLNIREDHGAQMAVVYEDPANDTALNDDAALVHLAGGLRETYFQNRDCDLVDNSGKCVGDGKRDITLQTIKQRWDMDSNNGVTDGQRWGIEDRLRVATYSFRHEDEALITMGSTHAPAILNSRFLGTAARMPALLFVRESRFKALNIDARYADGPVGWNGRALTLNMTGQPIVVYATVNTAYYRYDTGAGGWQAATPQEVVAETSARYPITQGSARADAAIIRDTDAYTTHLEVVLVQQGESEILGTEGGQSASGISSGGLFGGVSDLSFVGLTDDKLRSIYQQSLSAIFARQLPQVVRFYNYALGHDVPAWFGITQQGIELTAMRLQTVRSKLNLAMLGDQEYVANYSRYLREANNLEQLYERIKQPPQLNAFDRQSSNRIDTSDFNLRRAVLATGIATLFASGASLFLSQWEPTQTVGELALATIGAVSDVFSTIAMIKDVQNTIALINVSSNIPANISVLSFGHTLTSSAGKAGAIGAIIGGVISWGLFFVTWGVSGFEADSIEFYSLVAGAIAATIVAVVTFLVSLTVVGAIALALVAIFDLFALIFCKAGLKTACDIGIMQAVSKVISDWVYTGEVMIETQNEEFPIVNIEDIALQLTNPARGYVVGNGLRFRAAVQTHVRHNLPGPTTIWNFSDFYTEEDIKTTTVRYTLTAEEAKFKPQLNETQWLRVRPYARAVSLAPVPILGWLAPNSGSKLLHEAFRYDYFSSPVYQFSEASLNKTFPLWLNTGMALPRYDCWFGFCAHKSVQTATSQELGNGFVLDILPNTLDGFYNWTLLGIQTDHDGDGLNRSIDANDTTPDADGDGLNDAKERAIGSDPTKADSDGDGLDDLTEVRYGTTVTAADSDGDGINDYAEIFGYTLTLGGRQVHVVSNPLLRDADGDGVSDGAERRLNGINPTAYPFHPAVVNPSPAALYTDVDDFDYILPVGAPIKVLAVMANNTQPDDNLLARGSYSLQLPTQLGGASNSATFALLPGTLVSMTLSGTSVAGQRFVTVTASADANLVAYDTTPRAADADVQLSEPLPIKIDDDNPDEPTLVAGAYVQGGRTAIIGGEASDPTSYIFSVEVNVDGSGWLTATGGSIWAFPVDIPNLPSGNIPISVRVTDAVGHQTTKAFSLAIDNTPPASSVDLGAGAVRRVRRNADNAWALALAGTATDAGAGIRAVTLRIGNSSHIDVPADAFDGDGNWRFAYPFDDALTNANANPSGVYTLTVTTTDNALPDGNPVVQDIPFVIDMAPPVVELRSHRDEEFLTDGAVITGTVSDADSSVASVEYAFVAADTVLATEATLLDLPLNDLPETVLFSNRSNVGTRIFCLDETCPTSGLDGADGTAAAFDGNDMLRNFEPLPIGSRDTSIALWFKTTCADCGLFSVVQGDYPDQTQHDRDLYLAGGSVCVAINTETRCAPASNYNDGAWHHVVHTLGANGNHLYVDGSLAVSSPTTGSPFSGMDGILVGYSARAGTPFLTGALDAVVIYDGDLGAAAATDLYRPWQPATLAAGGTWSFELPADLEGYYQIDMRATDSVGNRHESRGAWPQLRGTVDTALPTFELTVGYSGSGSAAQTSYRASVSDRNLRGDDFSFVCPDSARELRFAVDPALARFAGAAAIATLAGIDSQCLTAGYQSSLVSVYACDAYDHCGAATPAQIVAYIGTRQNSLNPFGFLPNAIERVILGEPAANRVRVIERAGRYIYDIEVDIAGGKLYWSEGGDISQPTTDGAIWRANLDGSGAEPLVENLSVYAPEALQIAIDPPGNKLYWTAGYQLMWANLDGQLATAVYSMPDDPRVVGGFREYQSIGDVVVDPLNGKLYISERRNRMPAQNSLLVHSLIVELELDGNNPAFVTGVRDGCTYANWNDNLSMGVGPAQQPDTCLLPNGGVDVEALHVSDGTLYWSQYDELVGFIDSATGQFVSTRPNGKNPAVYGKRPGATPFLVAPLALIGPNSLGLNIGPVQHLYVNPLSGGVFVQHADQIVRAEAGGEFTTFTNFFNSTPAPVGTTTRRSSELTALAVVRVAGSVQSQTDLRVAVSSPDLVLVNGASGRYDVTVKNVSALPAHDGRLRVALPAAASFAGASVACAADGAQLTCDLGTLPAFSSHTLGISLTVSTLDVQTLSATFAATSATPDATPDDNSAAFANIIAAPDLEALPGAPYLYYMLNSTQMVRVPLFGDYKPQPLLFEGRTPANFVGMRYAIGSTADGQTLYFFDPDVNLTAINTSGGDRRVLANAHPTNTTGAGFGKNLAVASDPLTGHIYYTEQASNVWSRIKRMDADGSHVQLVNNRVLLLQSLVVDPLRSKLYWIAADNEMRRTLIYRSNLDGTLVEVVYIAPDGQSIRDLAIDPYAQTLFWLNPTFEDGAVMRSNTDGSQIGVLSAGVGSGVRGLVVRPEQNAIYYTAAASLYRNTLDGSDEVQIANLGNATLSSVNNLNPNELYWGRVEAPGSNLTYAIGSAFPPSGCSTNDTFEPNDTAATAAAVGTGSHSAALCRSALGATQDVDYYQIDVPTGQQLQATLRNLPADYNLQIRQADGVIATSTHSGTADESAVANNYRPQTHTYTVIVFTNASVNQVTPYTLDLALVAAPAQTEFENDQCFAVDPHEATPAAGNGSQGAATPLTVGQVITGALCFTLDTDFYSFSGTSGQTVNVTLDTAAANHLFEVYRPNGSYFGAFNANQPARTLALDATGSWAIAVRNLPVASSLTPYTLLVQDGTCGVNDAYEPNDRTDQPAAIDGSQRVFATLCNAGNSNRDRIRRFGRSKRFGRTNPAPCKHPASAANANQPTFTGSAACCGSSLYVGYHGNNANRHTAAAANTAVLDDDNAQTGGGGGGIGVPVSRIPPRAPSQRPAHGRPPATC